MTRNRTIGLVLVLCVSLSLKLIAQGVAPSERLQTLVGTWRGVLNTWAPPSDSAPTLVTITSAAAAHGLHEVWTQGVGRSHYEAHGLWAYDTASKQVRLFEVNSLGGAVMHTGRFDATGALVLNRKNAAGTRVLQRSELRWSADTIHFVSTYFGVSLPRRDSVILVRR